MPGRTYTVANGKANRYGFNGKENDADINSGAVAFEARIYDSRIGRFFSLDRFSNKFPNISPYIFAGNRPISTIDIKGDSLYILFYLQNSSNVGGEDMFHAAALTRSRDIYNTSTYDSKRDAVVIIGVQDVSDIISKVEETVTIYSPQYGNTVEFDFWSHGSFDGPVGSISPKKYDNGDFSNQILKSAWSKVKFNWSDNGNNCRANFIGCRLGDEPINGTKSFVYSTSLFENFKNVEVSGPTDYVNASKYVDHEKSTDFSKDGNRIVGFANGTYTFYPTYLVPTGKLSFLLPIVKPFRTCKNGVESFSQQKGDKYPSDAEILDFDFRTFLLPDMY
jgi:RHS repeat-associated protein